MLNLKVIWLGTLILYLLGAPISLCCLKRYFVKNIVNILHGKYYLNFIKYILLYLCFMNQP